MARSVGIVFSNIHDKEVNELTEKRTLASVPFGGRYRLIDFVLSNMVNSGITNVGVITKYNYQSLMNHDVVLIAGDISWAMKMSEVIPDLDYIASFPGKKIIIKGNHDYWWSSISLLRSVLPPDIYALQNDAIKIENVVFCGSRGWVCPEDCLTEADKKIYAREIIRMKLSLDGAAKLKEDGDKLVVMTHYPPFNFRQEDSPMTDLFEQYKVDAVVYGHLHGKSVRSVPVFDKKGIRYYLTSCDLVKNRLVDILT